MTPDRKTAFGQAQRERREIIQAVKSGESITKHVPSNIAALIFRFPANLWEDLGILLVHHPETNQVVITFTANRPDLRRAVENWAWQDKRTRSRILTGIYKALSELGEAMANNSPIQLQAALEGQETAFTEAAEHFPPLLGIVQQFRQNDFTSLPPIDQGNLQAVAKSIFKMLPKSTQEQLNAEGQNPNLMFTHASPTD